MRVSDPGEECRWQIDRTQSIYISNARSLIVSKAENMKAEKKRSANTTCWEPVG
jgi:hypothetical protein